MSRFGCDGARLRFVRRASGDNIVFSSHMTNRPLPPIGGTAFPEGVVHIERQRLLWQERMHERIAIASFATTRLILPLELEVGVDFVDMFEVRGMKRQRRGRLLEPRLAGNSIAFSYDGLDGVLRRSALFVSDPIVSFDGHTLRFQAIIERGQQTVLHLEVGPGTDFQPGERRWRLACAHARRSIRKTLRAGASIRASNPVFDEWLNKSRADLALLRTNLETGPYPYAGIPWFSTPFGRDGLITAMQILWHDPSLRAASCPSSPPIRRRRPRPSRIRRRARFFTKRGAAKWPTSAKRLLRNITAASIPRRCS